MRVVSRIRVPSWEAVRLSARVRGRLLPLLTLVLPAVAVVRPVDRGELPALLVAFVAVALGAAILSGGSGPLVSWRFGDR